MDEDSVREMETVIYVDPRKERQRTGRESCSDFWYNQGGDPTLRFSGSIFSVYFIFLVNLSLYFSRFNQFALSCSLELPLCSHWALDTMTLQKLIAQAHKAFRAHLIPTLQPGRRAVDEK